MIEVLSLIITSSTAAKWLPKTRLIMLAVIMFLKNTINSFMFQKKYKNKK